MKIKKTRFVLFDSLRIQLLSRSLLILAVLLILIGLLQYAFMRDILYRNKAVSLRSNVLSISPSTWQQFIKGPDNNDVQNPAFIFIPDASFAFIDLRGNYSVLPVDPGRMNPDFMPMNPDHGRRMPDPRPLPINITPPKLETREYFAALNEHFGVDYKIAEAGGREQLVVLQPILSTSGQILGIVQISTLTGPLKDVLIRQLLAFVILSIIALLFGLLAYLPVLKKTLVPLSNMVDTAEQIDAGNLARRFPIQQGQKEIDLLAESFNRMLERLELSFETERETKEQMRRFIADASHELRTPLTSIRGFLEVLLRGAASQPDQLDKALTSMHSESLRLNKLVNDLLLLTKLDRTPHLELKDGFLDRVIGEMEPQLRILGGNRELNLQIEADLKCKFDTDKMKQVILNLFQNAVQNTDPELGRINISLSRNNQGIHLSIQDNGTGISTVHMPHIFDRFYRSDSSRTRKYGGAGLGLSITKSIVDVHGGTISVESQEGQGSTFYVCLPA